MKELANHELHSRFAQLRAAEMRDVPDFRGILDGENSAPAGIPRSARRWPRRVAIPMALAAAVVLAAGIVRVSRRRAFIAAPLSTWTSPTVALLRTPGIGLLEPAHLLTSVLDPALTKSVPRRGTKR